MNAWMTGVALALATFVPVDAAAPANEGPLTLGRALAEALASSPRLDLARAAIQVARAEVRAARAAGRPSVDLNADGRLQGPRRTLELPKTDPNAPSVLVEKLLTPSQILETDLRLLLPLHTGGALAAERRAARRGRRAALARLSAEEQRLVLEVTGAYLAVLEAQRQTELAGAPRELVEERLRVARLRLGAGVGILLEASQAEAEVNAARAARRPQANLFGNYLSRVPATLPGSFAAALGAALLQSIYDGGRLQARVAATWAERNRRLALAEEGERQVDEQVEQTRVALEAAEERVAAEERRVAAAQEIVAVATRRLRAGTAATIEVTEAETVLARALTDAPLARFDASRAREPLAFAVGIADPDVVRGLVAAPPPQRRRTGRV